MRINAEIIDHNALRLVEELTAELYDFTNEGEDEDRMRVATLGEIRGICQMAKTMKEVLWS